MLQPGTRIMPRAFLFIAMLLLSAVARQSAAAGFDCAKAVSQSERLICADPALSRLDDQLVLAYRSALGKGAGREAVRRWQKTWLFSVRDACADAACLAKTYTAHIAELREHSQLKAEEQADSGSYVRYFRGEPDRHEAAIDVFALRDKRVRLVGSAVWVGNAATGNVNTGEINGVFRFDGKLVHYREADGDDGCRLILRFADEKLIVSDDNLRCGGMNVSFNGEYRRVGGFK